MFNEKIINEIKRSVKRFVIWLEKFGETSYDHQSYFAGPLGGRAKELYYKKHLLGTIAVAPMIFSEAFLPRGRQLFWKKQRLPIADAHYAMGFGFLYKYFKKDIYYQKAVQFLEVLEQTRCERFENYCWGYPFDWVTRNGIITKGTPLITTTPYAYEAFLQIYMIDKKNKWLDILYSIVEHVMQDIKDFDISPKKSTCSYTPDDTGGVVNASAYRAFLLTSGSKLFSEKRYWDVAERNLNFVLEAQNENGCWYYSIDQVRDFVDHFHTCFVLKALAKVEQLTNHEGCKKAIEKGTEYYTRNLFDGNGLPKPFSRAPRLTVYRHELYDYAECINLGVLLKNRFEAFDQLVEGVLIDLIERWQKADGSFRSRRLFIGWDNVPMHRWAQSQVFRSLCFLLNEGRGDK